MNKRFINDRGVLFELIYVKKDMQLENRIVVCKRVLDKKVFSFCEMDFTNRFQAA